MALHLTRAQVDDMIAHARAELPKECCGILAGRGESVARVFRARNADDSEYTFHIDDRDLLRISKEIDDLELELIGFYHSHPWSEATPSRTDIARAYHRDRETGQRSTLYPEAGYIIVSLADATDPEVKAFRIRDGSIVDEVLVLR
jgi:proteasome lid subunit RPN8/RPN11